MRTAGMVVQNLESELLPAHLEEIRELVEGEGEPRPMYLFSDMGAGGREKPVDSLVLDEVVHLVADLLHSLLRDLVPKDEALILRQRIHEVRGPRGAPCRGRRHIGHAVLNRPLAKLGGGTRLGGDCGRGLSGSTSPTR